MTTNKMTDLELNISENNIDWATISKESFENTRKTSFGSGLSMMATEERMRQERMISEFFTDSGEMAFKQIEPLTLCVKGKRG